MLLQTMVEAIGGLDLVRPLLMLTSLLLRLKVVFLIRLIMHGVANQVVVHIHFYGYGHIHL